MSERLSYEPLVFERDCVKNADYLMHNKSYLPMGITRKHNVPLSTFSEDSRCSILNKKDYALQSEVLGCS